MTRRRPNRRAVKKHYSYTIEEAARAVGVSRGTIRRWLQQNLPHLADQRPFLILGTDLIEFLAAKHAPMKRCAPIEFRCFGCRARRPAAEGLVDYVPRTDRSGQLTALCETFGTVMHKAFSRSKLPLLETVAAVSFPQGDPRITDRAEPCSDDHFKTEQDA